MCVCFLFTLRREVEQRGCVSSIREFEVWVSQFVKEGVATGLKRREAGSGRVLQQAGTQANRFHRRPWPEHLRTNNTWLTPVNHTSRHQLTNELQLPSSDHMLFRPEHPITELKPCISYMVGPSELVKSQSDRAGTMGGGWVT